MDIALVTSFPVGTGIFRFSENLAHFGFYSKLLYFNSLNNMLKADSVSNYDTITPWILPSKVSYVLSFTFPSVWSRELNKYEYAHVISPDFFHLSMFKKSIIGTVHDLYILENKTKLDYTWYYRFFGKMDLKYCYDLLGITTISKNTDRLLKHFFPKVKSKVIHHWTPNYFTKTDKSLCRKKLSLPDSKFILLNVSFNSFNKNLDFSGEIMDMLSDKFLLIHIGNTNIVCKNPSRILNINLYLDDHTLVEYYNSADVYLAPSTSEGFNRPIIEALNCGVPVLASDIDIFREVLMDSPYLVPLEVEKWKDIIISLTDEKTMKDTIDWYALKIGDYYRETRGKEEFYQYFVDLGIKI